MRVFVKTLSAVSEMSDQGVDEHVGGPSIESKHLFRLCGRGNDRDIGDATKIERNSTEFRVTIEKIVSKRNQRRALAAKYHVGRTQIAARSDAGASNSER